LSREIEHIVSEDADPDELKVAEYGGECHTPGEDEQIVECFSDMSR
jgi:hypothetical protein